LTALLIVRDSPYRHPVQALVSTGQFYGDLLYFASTVFDDVYAGKVYYRPEPFYFWVYFVFMNMFWLLVPGCRLFMLPCREVGLPSVDCLYSSIKASSRAFAACKVGSSGRVKKLL
jgi:cholestenol delta-isomerase